MRAVIQRVREASVRVDGNIVSSISCGFLVLLGVAIDDTENDAAALAEKIAGLRIFEDDRGAMNRALRDVNGDVLLVSQFTLLGDARRGRRPSFITAARGDAANALYERVAALLRTFGLHVETGIFGADMAVELVNDGPVTILLDSKKMF